MPLLRIRGITKHFGGLPAVDAVDLDVAAGELVAVIGANGAGKTTLLRMISGLLEPTRVDRLELDGVELVGRRAHQIRHLGVATVLQAPGGFVSMSVRDNVAVAAMFAGGAGGRLPEARAARRADELLSMIGLTQQQHVRVGQLTLRERRLLALAGSLAGQPRLLLVDEVMAGLTPSELDELVGTVRRVRDETGVALVWVEHVMAAVRALAERVVVLEAGRELAQGAPEVVMRHPAVVEAYLGRGGGGRARG